VKFKVRDATFDSGDVLFTWHVMRWGSWATIR
jgi:hypothetical protein